MSSGSNLTRTSLFSLIVYLFIGVIGISKAMFISLGTAIFGIVLIYLLYQRFIADNRRKRRQSPSTSDDDDERQSSSSDEKPINGVADRKNKQATKKPSKMDNKKKVNPTFVHPWLSATLKGHIGDVLDFDFSANGKYLVSCCGERSVIVWHTNEFESKDHKAVRGSFDYDNAHKICFAPDSISLIACMEHDYEVVVHKLAKKDSSALKIVEIDGVKFPYGDLHKHEVISMGVSVNGKYLMTASSDTTVVIRDLKGNVLKVLDSKLGNNYCAKISHCGRFVGCSGFTPDVKVWEVEFARNDEFKDVTRAFDLKGHSSGIRSFDFNQDSTLMVSASKDGTFRVWNTDIKYKLGQEPYLLLEKPCDELKKSEYVSVALSPNGEVVALALDKIVKMFCAQSGDCLGVVKQDPVNNVPGLFTVGPKFSADGKFIVLALNRQILIFHNVPGYKTAAKVARDLAKHATSAAHKERLLQQADEAELAAAKFPSCE